MIRREALKKMTMAMGGALSATTLSAVLTHCSSKKKYPQNGQLLFFDQDQFQSISAIVDRIIPKTDTPGAIEAKVPDFIDLMLSDCYKGGEQTKFLTGLTNLLQKAESDAGDELLSLKEEKLDNFLTDFEEKIDSQENNDGDKFFIATLKELTLLGYFTSKEGATQALRYVPVPGKFDPCIEIDDERAWAS